MKYLEIFAGIGGFRRGLEELGHECVGWVEWDKFARQSYQAIFPTAKDEYNAGDITAVTDESLRELTRRVGQVDLIAGGFPCQAFSVAGKRRGFEDTRGTLFFDVARFAMVLRPKLLLLENVPGLLNHDGGRTFYTILCALDELGYDAEWQVLNAKNFGIPQNRERVFVAGHLRESSRRKVFPLRETDSQTAAELKCVGMLDIKGQDVIKRVYSPTGISPTLTTMAGGNREPKIMCVGNIYGNEKERNPQAGRIYDPDGLCPTIAPSSPKGSIEQPKIIQRGRGYNDGGLHDIAPTVSSHSYHENNMVVSAVNDCARENKTQNGRRIKEPDEPMFTLTGQDRHGVLVTRKGYGEESEWIERDTVTCLDANYFKGLDAHQLRTGVMVSKTIRTSGQGSYDGKHTWNLVPDNARIRKLTPKECWRLMGRQDWEFERAKQAGVSDSQLYKQAGNSLVPQIVTAIAKNFE